MPMGPGGMNQSGPPPQPPHGHNMPSEGMVSSGPPAPHIPNQMNGQMPGKWTLLSPAWSSKIPSSCFSLAFSFSSFRSVFASLVLPSNTTEMWGRLVLLKDDVIFMPALLVQDFHHDNVVCLTFFLLNRPKNSHRNIFCELMHVDL